MDAVDRRANRERAKGYALGHRDTNTGTHARIGTGTHEHQYSQEWRNKKKKKVRRQAGRQGGWTRGHK